MDELDTIRAEHWWIGPSLSPDNFDDSGSCSCGNDECDVVVLLARLDAMTTERNGWGDTAREYKAALDAATEREKALREALVRIDRMDYRGNRTPEQDIARAALAEPTP